MNSKVHKLIEKRTKQTLHHCNSRIAWGKKSCFVCWELICPLFSHYTLSVQHVEIDRRFCCGSLLFLCLCLYFGSSIMLVTYFVNFRLLNDQLFGKELFILFAASAFRKLSSIYVFSYFPFGFEGRIWDLIVSVPDHCLSFYFETSPRKTSPRTSTIVQFIFCFGPLRSAIIFWEIRNKWLV